MKKNYQSPRTSILNADMKSMILAGSGTVTNVDSGDAGIGFGGGGGGGARAKGAFWDM